jgi:hypothetical protein
MVAIEVDGPSVMIIADHAAPESMIRAAVALASLRAPTADFETGYP